MYIEFLFTNSEIVFIMFNILFFKIFSISEDVGLLNIVVEIGEFFSNFEVLNLDFY